MDVGTTMKWNSKNNIKINNRRVVPTREERNLCSRNYLHFKKNKYKIYDKTLRSIFIWIYVKSRD